MTDERNRYITVFIDEIPRTLALKTIKFKSGSVGFQGVGKIKIGEMKYQAICNFILVGSNPTPRKKGTYDYKKKEVVPIPEEKAEEVNKDCQPT